MTLVDSAARLVPRDLVLFHGGRLIGDVELRTKAKSMAYGPGFYMTTSYWTAREYRGGNGSVYRVRVAGDLRWSHRVRLSYAEMAAFLQSVPKLKRRKEVLAELRTLFMRQHRDLTSGTLSVVALMNTLDLHQSYGASVAREVAHALVAANVDATLVTGANGGNEDWVVLHNVAKVRAVEKTTGPETDIPRFSSET